MSSTLVEQETPWVLAPFSAVHGTDPDLPYEAFDDSNQYDRSSIA